jgi:hypothetical protein
MTTMRVLGGVLMGASVGAAVLVACQFPDDTGYVEIKTVPVSTTVGQAPLYLDSVKLESLRKGVAVLRMRVGTSRLAIDNGVGHLAPICDIVVKKNRITSVTLSVIERPPRCQCRNNGWNTAARTCVS